MSMTYCDRKVEKFKFYIPGTVLIAGSTSSGKTHLVSQILKHREKLIEKPVAKIIYYYKTWQPLYDVMRSEIPEIIFKNELDITEPEKSSINKCTVVIFDDVSEAMRYGPTAIFILSHFTIFSNHCRYLTIYICQNLYEQTRYQRTLSLNCSYLILFRNLRDSEQIARLAVQVYGKGRAKHFLELYSKIMTGGRRFSYVILNLHPFSPIGQTVYCNIIQDRDFHPDGLERIFVPKPTGSYI